jgi:hypothetical protein
MKECPADTCLNCSTPYKEKDIIKLNPDDEERKLIKQKLKEEKKVN